MAYEPGHDIFVGYALETSTVTESTDGETPPTPPAAPGSFAIIGYMKNTSEVKRGLNNSWGYAVGSPQAAYRKRGARNPEMSQTISVTDFAFCKKAIRDPTTGLLPRLCLAIGRPNVWTLLIRDAKINTLALSCSENPTGEAKEIEAQVQIMGCYTQNLSSPLNPSLGMLLRALGDPFYWHDCRTFNVTAHDASVLNYKRTMMSWSASLNNNLERKGLRENFGDNNGLSITNYSLLEHNEVVTGEIGLHGRLAASYFDAAAQAQDWGNIELTVSNAAGLDDPDDGKGGVITLTDAFPFDNTLSSVESNGQIASTISYGARGMAIV